MQRGPAAFGISLQRFVARGSPLATSLKRGPRLDGDPGVALAPRQQGRYTPPMDVLDRITHDPQVMGGRPCIRGLRVTVGTIVGLLAAGQTEAEVLAAYPYLEPGDVQAALAYAAWRTQETELPLP